MAVLDFTYDEQLFPSHLRHVLEVLMDTADKRESMQEWFECFSATAKIWRNGKTFNGSDEIKEMLYQSWDDVKWRNHKPKKVFILGNGSNEIMVDGTTEYHFEDGRVHEGRWAAQVAFVQQDEEWKIEKYTVLFV